MTRKKILLLTAAALAVVALIAAAYFAYTWYTVTRYIPTDEAQVRMVVSSFGDQLQEVPLVAPPKVVAFAMDKYYAQYVHPDLLTKWEADPLHAPGRLQDKIVPNRIDVTKVTKNADKTYTVEASIVLYTDFPKDTASKLEKVSFTLTQGPDGYQITEYHPVP